MKRLAVLAAATALALGLAAWWPHVRNEFFVLLGSRDMTGGWYGFNSGAAGAFYMSVVPAAAVLWYHQTCHDSWHCLRRGKYQAAGGTFRLCRRHHPDMAGRTGSRRDLIRRLHREHQDRLAGRCP